MPLARSGGPRWIGWPGALLALVFAGLFLTSTSGVAASSITPPDTSYIYDGDGALSQTATTAAFVADSMLRRSKSLAATSSIPASGVAAEGAIPEESEAVLRGIQRDGVVAEQGVSGPSIPGVFRNDGGTGGSILPRLDDSGTPITYRKWGTVPGAGNLKPGGERIVTGSDGSFWYSPDHYRTFIRWWP
jgi:guanyl-specific ribonuclease Sa